LTLVVFSIDEVDLASLKTISSNTQLALYIWFIYGVKLIIA